MSISDLQWKNGKSDYPDYAITPNEYGEYLKYRPVVVINNWKWQGINYTLYIKLATEHFSDKPLSSFSDDQDRLIKARSRYIRHNGEMTLPAGAFIDANDRQATADCAKWYIMPTSQFEASFSDAIELNSLNDTYAKLLLNKMYHLQFQQPPAVSLNLITLNDNKVEHELLYAHKDLLYAEAWTKTVKPDGNGLRYTRYEKVTYKMPPLLELDFDEGLKIIRALSTPLADMLSSAWQDDEVEEPDYEDGDVRLWSHKDLNIAHLVNNLPAKDPWQGMKAKEKAKIDSKYKDQNINIQ